MLKRLLTVGAMVGLLATTAVAQQTRECATMDVHNHQLETNPKYAERMAQIEEHTNRVIENKLQERSEVTGVITIPVVVHVVYNTASENISDAQINDQISILNEDFRATNADVSNTPSLFASRVADMEIEFVLDQIVRVSTGTTSFSSNDAMKYTSQGGSNAISPTTKLNMWVCDLAGGLLGYAQFPGGAAATDGVVMDYQYFGSIGTATAPFDKGRTATHEVGHWVNLRHIWGDGNCSQDDFVSDTPAQGQSNGGCPTFGINSCSGGDPDMFMNYMDYVNDACMYMFTTGQKTRARAIFGAGGARESFATGGGGGGGGGACVPGDVTLTLTTDNYGSETSWTLTKDGTQVASGSGYGNNTTINETFAYGAGNYVFTINDSYGDGMCCSYGNGSYTLKDGTGATIKSGGSFGASEATTFCVEGGGGGGATTNNCGSAANTSAATGAWNYYTWNVDAGTQELVVSITGGTGDADLYVRQGSNNPTTTTYDCRPYKSGNEETCTIPNPGAGTWKIGVRAYSAFSGVTLDVCNNGVPARSILAGGEGLAFDGDVMGDADMMVYPNPVQDVLNLQLGVDMAEGSDVVIFSLSGQEALRISSDDVRNGVDVSQLRDGMYLISIEDDKHNTVTQRFIKQ